MLTEKCSAGGYNVSFHVASSYDSGKLHLESDGVDKTGAISVPNAKGFQNWTVVKKSIELNAGQHVFKVCSRRQSI